VLFLLGMAVVAGLRWYSEGLVPANPGGQPKIVRIAPGSSVDAIAQKLRDEGLIRNADAFKVMLKVEDLTGKLKAGVFELSPSMDAREVAEHIASGEVVLQRLTVPEGFTLTQVAERVEQAGLAQAEEIEEAAVAETAASDVEMPLPDDSLEGYLFPETYDFVYDIEAEAIVARMVRELDRRFYQPHRLAIEERGLTLHEIVTLASLVEREARVPEERARIAGVIQNRLDRGMKLQIDATVQYALPEHKERLLFEDLEVESPYNTYLHEGLPPGPIASPGLPSLMAALQPESTEALFYVARPDGSHIFSPTYREHQQAIEQIRGR
jgi:UPF0755 protein